MMSVPVPGGSVGRNGGAGNCAQIRAQISNVLNTIRELNAALARTSSAAERADLENGIQIANQELSALQEQARLACAPPPPPRQIIRILLVTDGSGGHVASFGPEDRSTADAIAGTDYFGLSELIRTLATGTPFFYFELIKAHRNQDPGYASTSFAQLPPEDQLLFKPDYQGFSFISLDLSQFDAIWLFAVGGPGEADPLSPQELAALAKFMDGGGGIFATGDHENLGLPLCGYVPRVRSMRKWWTAADPNPLPGAPMAPSALGTDRIDTTRAGHNDDPPMGGVPVYPFDNQSDDIPQPITPTLYAVVNPVSGDISLRPHPVLSSVDGPIAVLPDHMHEGEVIVPWDATLTGATDPTLAFAGPQFVEYPNGLDGTPILPEIIATGQVIAHITAPSEYHTTQNDTATAKTSVGLIGAYDGRATNARVGRIVIDSTWHHFFDINLIGDPQAKASDPKISGFLASDQGRAVLGQIQTYYRNIAVWLAREQTHAHSFRTAIHYLSLTQPLNMIIQPHKDVTQQDMLVIGAIGRQALARVAPPALLADWLEANVERLGSKAPAYDRGSVVEAVLGAAVPAAMKALEGKTDLDPEETITLLNAALDEGFARGLAALTAQLESRSADLRKMSHELKTVKMRK